MPISRNPQFFLVTANTHDHTFRFVLHHQRIHLHYFFGLVDDPTVYDIFILRESQHDLVGSHLAEACFHEGRRFLCVLGSQNLCIKHEIKEDNVSARAKKNEIIAIYFHELEWVSREDCVADLSKVIKFVLLKLCLILEEVERTSCTRAKYGWILFANLYELKGPITTSVMKNCLGLFNIDHTHWAFLFAKDPIDSFVALQQTHWTNSINEGHFIRSFPIWNQDSGGVDQADEILPKWTHGMKGSASYFKFILWEGLELPNIFISADNHKPSTGA